METMLATMPQMECSSVGAFPETNRAVATSINIMVDKGSDVPESHGCCHGKELARGVRGVAAQFLGCLGRALLEGAVGIRHVALAAVGGVEIQEPAASRGAAGHLGDEWCSPAAPRCLTTRVALG